MHILSSSYLSTQQGQAAEKKKDKINIKEKIITLKVLKIVFK